jgi:hypothetical protein
VSKKGAPYEQVVADICRSFDDVSDVAQGDWIEGPDGRRDRDASFTGLVGGVRYSAVIECKDYNPESTGKVGIEVVDQFDSKRRDLKIDFPMICSNAGFTQPALTKARRVGISTIAALRMGDERIQFEVRDTIYTRKITVPGESIRAEVVMPPGHPEQLHEGYSKIFEATFAGCSVPNWFIHRIMLAIGANPIVSGRLRCGHKFLTPLVFGTPYGDIGVAELNLTFPFSGAWYRHEITIDATNGFYDWVRKRTRHAPGNTTQFQIRNLEIHEGIFVNRPPDYILAKAPPLAPGESDMRLLMIHMAVPTGRTPPLDEHLIPADRNLILEGLDQSHYTSTPGYVHPK